MKLCKLKLKNLNSFRKEVEIDFEGEKLKDASLVAITGPTGSGKTTLLDAICVALYGKTPRLTGSGSQNPHHLISHGEKEAFAEVHFMADGTRYIATWSIKRRSSANVRLSYAADGKLISDKLSTRGKSLGSSQNTVSEEVESLLGLDFDAFKRSVMLAQGEFAAFLKASNEERRKILEATAGIGIYDILRQALLDKVKEVEAANAEVLKELDKIPDASHDQLTEAESDLDELQKEVETLGAQSQQSQQEKDRETKRKEDFEKLQSLEKRQVELMDQQSEIDARQTEQENAQRAERLRPEKQTYDVAKSDREKAKEALSVAATEKTEAKNQVEINRADFEKKNEAYQTASTEHNQKTDIYTAAKLDVGRAADQFAEVDKRTTAVEELDSQIDALSNQLADKETEKTELQKQIDEAQIFLDDNPLPSDRQHRLNRANVLLTQLDSHQKQLQTALASEVAHSEKVSSLKREIKALSKTRDERLAEKTNAETALKTATDELNILLASGTREEWDDRKQQATEAQPIAQRYETVEANLVDSEDDLRKLNETKANLDAELKRIEAKLGTQAEVCQRAAEAVQHSEEAQEFALLENPINKLRQHLHTGEPCLVCGAREHPWADVVEPENEDLLQNANAALDDAKSKAQTAEEDRQNLKTRQIETERDRRNTDNQINECADEIQALRNEKAECLVEWQEICPNTDVSSGWVAEQIDEADTTIAALGTAEKIHTDASYTYQIASQQLNTYENNVKRETKALNDVERQMQDVINDIEDLKVDIASTEERFWEFLPASFHGVTPDTAVSQFSKKIEEIEMCESELRDAEIQLKLLDAEIKTDQGSLETLRNSRDDLQDEIDEYRREGEAFLDAVREKTGGLEKEDDINAAIDKLQAELQSKEIARDEAEQQLQHSQTLLTQKQTTHEHCEEQHEEAVEKRETARNTYFDKLKDVGFDSPEAHHNAFRDDAQRQKLTDQIKAYQDEKQQLALEITALRTRFQETPFDPEALDHIEIQVQEIGGQLQEKQKEVGAQGERISVLKDALEKREVLGDEIAAAEAELRRWKTLQQVIPANSLRDFALEIMFKQMGSLANEQLNYLTSERYQLKVETIGDLTVVDRWNANEERPVETLSGGESFLTSLALALALADLSRGRARLNSLFLDEGFGTLDTETLDIAIAALEGLRMQGRSIFLISHIQELTRRLPVKINVRKHGNDNSDGLFSSSIDIRG